MTLLAVRLIDLAIFGSLGALWIGGAVFIVVLYRWILRFEAESGPTHAHGVPVEEPAPPKQVESDPAPRHAVRLPHTAAARQALASHV
ncbi:MAG: hypothetical protein KDK70_19275 [Myxococcales bacterium]|nr:hypothetical protein [Myxococcales bacterium]